MEAQKVMRQFLSITRVDVFWKDFFDEEDYGQKFTNILATIVSTVINLE